MEGLHTRRFIDRLVEDVLEVTVDRTLVDGHQLLIKNVLTISQDLLSLSATGFLGLALPSNVFGNTHHVGNLALLLQADEFLRQVVHGLRDDAGLDGLSDTIEQSLLVVLQDLLVLVSGVAALLVVLASTQLGDQLESLLLALEHHILVSSAADQSLKENDSLALPVSRVGRHVLDAVDIVLSDEVSEDVEILLVPILLLGLVTFLNSRFFIDGLDVLRLNGSLCLLELFNVSSLFAGKTLDEFLLELINGHFRVEDLARERDRQLLNALITGQRLGLNFILIGFLVK